MKRAAAFCLSFVFLFSYIASYTCLDVSAANNSSFKISQIDWLSMPQYIQDIVFSSITATSSSIKTPFILVRVGSSNYQIWVGFNYSVAFNSYNSCYYIDAPTSPEPCYKNTVVYTAQYKISNNAVSSDWSTVNFTKRTLDKYASKLTTSTSTYDFYYYGAFYPNYDYKQNDDDYMISTENTSGTEVTVCFNVGIYSSSMNPFWKVDNLGGLGSNTATHFTPKTADQQAAETSGGILAQIKALPDKISGFFTNLSDNIKGFFTSLGDRISGFFDNLFENIKALFIPNSDDISNFVNDFKSWLQERLGFLYEIPDLFIQIFNKLISFNPKESDYAMTFPKLQAPEIVDGSVVWHNITDETVVDFSFINDKPFSTLYAFYKSFVWLAYCLMLANLINKKYNEFIGGGS